MPHAGYPTAFPEHIMPLKTTIPRRARASSVSRLLHSAALVFPLVSVASHRADAQGTLEDYRRASTIGQKYAGLTVGVLDGGVTWVGTSNRFWYRVSVAGGHRFVVGDAEGWSKKPAFDHDRMAAAVRSASGTSGATVTAITKRQV